MRAHFGRDANSGGRSHEPQNESALVSGVCLALAGSVSGRKRFENGGLGWSAYFGATDRKYWPITGRHMEIQQPIRQPQSKKGTEISNPFLLYKQDLLATA